MYHYRAFGMLIQSDWPLPELTPATADNDAIADLSIELASVGRPMPEPDSSPIFDYEDPDGVVMIWPQVGGFRIKVPGTITLEPARDARPEYVAFPLLGPVMGWFLHMRSRMILHGSAVQWRGKSFGFLGDKLAGKSTTAAAFLRAGAHLLTDDLLVFDMSDRDEPLIQPAFAQLKLSEESASSVHIEGSKALPLVMEGFPKRQYRLSTLAESPAACDALFVLEREDGPAGIDWVGKREALTCAMRFSYNVRFANAPLEMQKRKQHFEFCASLTRAVKVGILHVPADLERLDEVVDEVAQVLSVG